MNDGHKSRIPYRPLTGPAMKACLLFAAGIIAAQHIHPYTLVILFILSLSILLTFLLTIHRHDTLGTLAASVVMVYSGMAVWSVADVIHRPVEIPVELNDSSAAVIKRKDGLSVHAGTLTVTQHGNSVVLNYVPLMQCTRFLESLPVLFLTGRCLSVRVRR